MANIHQKSIGTDWAKDIMIHLEHYGCKSVSMDQYSFDATYVYIRDNHPHIITNQITLNNGKTTMYKVHSLDPKSENVVLVTMQRHTRRKSNWEFRQIIKIKAYALQIIHHLDYEKRTIVYVEENIFYKVLKCIEQNCINVITTPEIFGMNMVFFVHSPIPESDISVCVQCVF